MKLTRRGSFLVGLAILAALLGLVFLAEALSILLTGAP